MASPDNEADNGGHGLIRPAYQRVLLKLGGEMFGGGAVGLDPDVVALVARQIAEVVRAGAQVAVVIAPPQQHDVHDFVGILVEKLSAARIFDVSADVVVGVLVPTQLLDDLIFVNAQSLGVVRRVRRGHRCPPLTCLFAARVCGTQ
mgnify:CR=1 FL=1